jgi:hypothetical protein
MSISSTADVARIEAGVAHRRGLPVAAWPVIALALLVTVQAVRAVPRLDDTLLYGDSATYLLLGESLASGTGYRDVAHPDSPPHVHYPPGLPIMLAATRLTGADSVPAAKTVVLLLGLAAAPATYLLLQPQVGPVLAGLIAAWVALHPDYLRTATTIGSDAPYLFLSLLSMLAVLASSRHRGWQDWQGLAAWAATTAAALTRSVGIALIAVAPLYLAWHKAEPRWGARIAAVVLLGAIYVAPIAAWEWWKVANPSTASTPYTELWKFRDELDWDKGTVTGLADITERFVTNGRRCVRSLGGLFIDAGTDRQRSLLGLAVLGLIAAGAIVALRRNQWFVGAYLVIAAVGSLGNPQQPLPRYLMTFLPFILFYPLLLLAARGATGRRVALVVGIIAVGTAVTTLDVAGREHVLRPAFADYHGSARWLAAHTPSDTVILSRKPPLVYLWSERKSIGFPRSRNTVLLDEQVKRWGVTHVIEDSFSPLTTHFLDPWLREHNDDLTVVYTTGNTRIWALNAPVAGRS